MIREALNPSSDSKFDPENHGGFSSSTSALGFGRRLTTHTALESFAVDNQSQQPCSTSSMRDYFAGGKVEENATDNPIDLTQESMNSFDNL